MYYNKYMYLLYEIRTMYYSLCSQLLHFRFVFCTAMESGKFKMETTDKVSVVFPVQERDVDTEVGQLHRACRC